MLQGLSDGARAARGRLEELNELTQPNLAQGRAREIEVSQRTKAFEAPKAGPFHFRITQIELYQVLDFAHSPSDCAQIGVAQVAIEKNDHFEFQEVFQFIC